MPTSAKHWVRVPRRVVIGAVVGVGVLHGGSVGAQPVPDLCAVPGVAAVCDATPALGLPNLGVGDLAANAADSATDSIARWVASGAADLLGDAGSAILSGTEVDVAGGPNGGPWLAAQWRIMVTLAAALMVPMLVIAAIHAAVSGSGALLARALANLPVAALGTGVAITVVQLALEIVDAACVALVATIPKETESFLTGLAVVLSTPSTELHPFTVALLGAVMAVLAFVLWVELVIRQAAIYLAVLFLPLGFAALVWPALGSWLRRLIETLLGLILSKLVIMAALALASSAVANQQGLGALVSGTAMLLLAVCAPFSLFSLIPLAGLANIAALEGRRQTALRPAARLGLARLARK